jgi:hypothetical protein
MAPASQQSPLSVLSPGLRSPGLQVLVLMLAAALYGGLTVRAAGMPGNRLQARGQAQNPACALFTAAEIRTITGFSGYENPSPGDDPGQGAGGGASCQYSKPVFPRVDASGKALPAGKGPMLSIVLIDGKDYTRTAKLAPGCTKESVSGVGDEAHFGVCASSREMRTAPLYVKVGSKDLIVQLDVEPPDTEAGMRPKAIAVAKAAAAKLR